MVELKKYLKKSDACAEALRWVGDRTLQQAWDECERPDWMLWLYKRNNPNKKTCVKIATYAAKLCIENYKNKYPADKCPEEAIAAAEKWLENPSVDNARAAAAAAKAATAAADAAAKAATADADAAVYAAEAAAATTADAAARAASCAARDAATAAAAYNAAVDAYNTIQTKIADHIRLLIPTVSITDKGDASRKTICLTEYVGNRPDWYDGYASSWGILTACGADDEGTPLNEEIWRGDEPIDWEIVLYNLDGFPWSEMEDDYINVVEHYEYWGEVPVLIKVDKQKRIVTVSTPYSVEAEYRVELED